MGSLIDLTGQKFFRLTVVERLENNKHKKALWKCLCACGQEVTVLANNLRRGGSKSCGLGQCHSKSTLKHGQRRSPTYSSFVAMKKRCLNPNAKCYPHYGGANPPVTICDRWKDSFENFLADMGERPIGTSLGRKGDVGNYIPGNVSWQTFAEQAANRRPDRCRSKKITEEIAA
jgi:hypothetical protein